MTRVTRWDRFDLAVVFGLFALLSWAISTPTTLADDVAERDTDAASLQGTWEVEVHDTHGKPASKKFLALKHQWVFTKDAVSMKSKGGERKGSFRLDPKQDPKTLDITQEPGLPPGPKAKVPQKEVLQCIYTLDGDSLKICYGLSPNRPTAFKSTAQPAFGLVVLRRQPPAKEKPNKD